jgi:hypothetical protein
MAAAAQAHVSIVNAGAQGKRNPLDAIDSHPLLKQNFTVTATSQASTIVAPAALNLELSLWEVTAADQAVWIKFGTAPTAAPGADFLVPIGQTRRFTALAGDKVALILV